MPSLAAVRVTQSPDDPALPTAARDDLVRSSRRGKDGRLCRALDAVAKLLLAIATAVVLAGGVAFVAGARRLPAAPAVVPDLDDPADAERGVNGTDPREPEPEEDDAGVRFLRKGSHFVASFATPDVAAGG